MFWSFCRRLICLGFPRTVSHTKFLPFSISRLFSVGRIIGLSHTENEESVETVTGRLSLNINRPLPSAEIKIPRFLRKMKDKEQIERYCLMKNLCAEKKFDTALYFMKEWLEKEPATASTVSILNGLLHDLYEEGKMEDMISLKQIMDTHNIKGDRSTYVVLIDGFGKMKNVEKVSELLEEMKTIALVPHERSYIVAAELALETGSFSEALSYCRKIEAVHKETHDEFYGKFLSQLMMAELHQPIEEVLDDFKRNRMKMGEKTLAATKRYFDNFFNGKWKTSLTKVSPSGVCHNCQCKLEGVRFGKQEENLISYFRHFLNLKLKSKQSDKLNPSSEHDFQTKDEKKLLLLEKHLKNNGPFNVVVDGLNIAMHSSYGLDIYSLCRVAEYFIAQGKRVLVVAANDLISPKKSKTTLAVQHHHGMMHLRQFSSVYLVKQNQSGIDDLFLIFAALLSCLEHNDVQLVTNDKFMDHRFHMKPQIARDFNQWLYNHQVMIKGHEPTSGKPLLGSPPNYASVVQSTCDSWHFPSTDGKTWLCVKRE